MRLGKQIEKSPLLCCGLTSDTLSVMLHRAILDPRAVKSPQKSQIRFSSFFNPC